MIVGFVGRSSKQIEHWLNHSYFSQPEGKPWYNPSIDGQRSTWKVSCQYFPTVFVENHPSFMLVSMAFFMLIPEHQQDPTIPSWLRAKQVGEPPSASPGSPHRIFRRGNIHRGFCSNGKELFLSNAERRCGSGAGHGTSTWIHSPSCSEINESWRQEDEKHKVLKGPWSCHITMYICL